MPPVLRLYEDIFSSGASGLRFAPLPRMVFVVHGSLTAGGRTLAADEAWHGEEAVTLAPGADGATCWRFELSPGDASGNARGDGFASRHKLSAELATLPQGALLLRGDSVGFPPGGCAYLHRHRGPGIRCLVEGGIRIDSHGRSTCYGPGDAWYESGPDPVFAQAASDRATRFVRVMILPRDFLGKSSIEYLSEDDKNKPKSQSYRIFADMPIAGDVARK